jgi:membrane protease YdiL (CAAX protease family)
VLAFLLAPFVAASAWAASRGSRHHYVQGFLSDHALLLNGAVEAALLGLALVYFHWRGWKPADLRIRPGIWSSLGGLVLMPTVLVTNACVVFALFLLVFLCRPGVHDLPRFAGFIMANSPRLDNIHAERLSWSVLIVAMVLNAFFEEIVCTSYMFNQFAARRGPIFALIFTVLLRAGCHTYQGVVHAAGIGAVFLIFGLVYWRTRNVWTLVFAHALLDLGSLSAVKMLVH